MTSNFGYGRGGRGAALQEFLNRPPRQPGSTEATAQSEDTIPDDPRPAPALGRGAYLETLRQKLAAQQQTVGNGETATAPKGRGLAQWTAMMQGYGTLPPTARGMALARVQGTQSPTQPGAQIKTQGPEASISQQTAVQSSAGPQEESGKANGIMNGHLERLNLKEKADTVHVRGTNGKKVSLSANYVRLNCSIDAVYQYHVDFQPIIDSIRIRKRMLREHNDVLGQTREFDGSVLYRPVKLPQQETVLTSVRHADNTPISIVIRLTKILPPTTQALTQLYNIIFRRIMAILEMVQVGRYYYNPDTPASIPQHKLEVWPGYVTAVNEQEGGLMLLADASHKVLRTETVLDVMNTIRLRNPQGSYDEIQRTLLGVVILTRYNNKTYRIDDIVWNKTPRDSFSLGTGETTTFLEYYRKHYNIKIQDEDQCLLVHRPKKKMQQPREREKKQLELICLVPELCHMTGLSDELRQDFHIRKDLSAHTRLTPEQRRLTLKKFIDSVNNNPEARSQLERWGLQLDTSTVEFEGRQLQWPDVRYGNKSVPGNPKGFMGRDTNVITPVHLKCWVVLYINRNQKQTNDYVGWMQKVGPQMGIEVHPPTRFELANDRTETFIGAIRENINPKVQVVVIICPTSRDDRYSAIKKLCCVECPVPSQVIIAKTISKRDTLRSVTHKIALQINCKLGGELWTVPIPLKTTMMVGIDVCHDSRDKRQSIAGFVASINQTCTRWYSRVCFQSVSQELVDSLKTCLVSAITKYHEVNHTLPDRIVVFRDGVGDSQLNTVSDYEVDQLRKCFHHFGDEYTPGIAVIIVQKRISTRIFSKIRGQLDNPAPGTVVDHTITRRNWADFFLVSQHVGQGTVTPTHYVVVHNSSRLTADHLQQLSYKMTYLYYNWPGTIRVPAPCQYAHKLAYLVGQNLHKAPAPELSDRLFFL